MSVLETGVRLSHNTRIQKLPIGLVPLELLARSANVRSAQQQGLLQNL